MRQVVIPDRENSESYAFRPRPPFSDDEFFRLCMDNPDLRIEREADGEVTIMPPTGLDTGDRNDELSFQLRGWAKRDGRGRTYNSSTEFILPDGAGYSPDASWVLKSRIAKLTKEQRTKFPPLCPDFIAELMSPSDRLREVKAKMTRWMANGVALGWLIDPARRTVHIYRPGAEPEARKDIDYLGGEGPIEGFRLDLTEIWDVP